MLAFFANKVEPFVDVVAVREDRFGFGSLISTLNLSEDLLLPLLLLAPIVLLDDDDFELLLEDGFVACCGMPLALLDRLACLLPAEAVVLEVALVVDDDDNEDLSREFILDGFCKRRVSIVGLSLRNMFSQSDSSN